LSPDLYWRSTFFSDSTGCTGEDASIIIRT
jgi:hypothetical protein